MALSLPTSGSLSKLTIANWFGQNPSSSSTANSVRLGGTGTPWSLNQIVFSNTNSTTPSSNTRSIADYRGAKFAMFSNSSRTSAHGSTYSNTSGGSFTCYFGIHNRYGTNSGMLYSYNRGFPITLHFQTISGNLSNIVLRVKTGTSNTLQTLSVPFGVNEISFVGNYWYFSISMSLQGATWEGLVTASPGYHGSYTGQGDGYHKIGMDLELPGVSSDSSFGPPMKDPPKFR